MLVLNWVEEIAALRPDDMLAIITPIIDGEEQPVETLHDQRMGTFKVSHSQVLERTITILNKTVYRGDLNTSIVYLHQLALYRLEESVYAEVRAKTGAALSGLGSFKHSTEDASK